MRAFLRDNKKKFGDITAEVLGYPRDQVAVVPDPIRQEDMDLSDNILPLEFVIDAGDRVIDRVEESAEEIKNRILAECPGASKINFGVWLRGLIGAFVEHKPVQSGGSS